MSENERLSGHKVRVGISAGHCHWWRLSVLRTHVLNSSWAFLPETWRHRVSLATDLDASFIAWNLVKECDSNNFLTFKMNTQVPYPRPDVKWYSYPPVKCFPLHTLEGVYWSAAAAKNALGIKATGIKAAVVSVHVVDRILPLLSTRAHYNSFWWSKADELYQYKLQMGKRQGCRFPSAPLKLSGCF